MDKSKSSNNLFNSKNSIQKDEDHHDNDDDTNEIIILEDKQDEEKEGDEELKSEGTEDRFVQNMNRKNKTKQVMSIKISKSTFFNANSFVRGESK
jgi:hypothetical protein